MDQHSRMTWVSVLNLTGDISQMVDGWSLAPLVKNLQAFRGIQLVTAAGLSAEVGDFLRFATAGQFMAFAGLVPSEDSTGARRCLGGITKSGRHLRRLLIEAAWHYYRTPLRVSAELHARRVGVPPEVIAVADKALRRLGTKAYRMKQGPSPRPKSSRPWLASWRAFSGPQRGCRPRARDRSLCPQDRQ